VKKKGKEEKRNLHVRGRRKRSVTFLKRFLPAYLLGQSIATVL
jgi:hypothetical protein